MRTARLAVGVALVAFASPALAAINTIYDGDFNPSDWAAIVHTVQGGAYNVTSQQSMGGNPDMFRFTINHLPGFSSVGVRHYNVANAISPSQIGGIGSRLGH